MTRIAAANPTLPSRLTPGNSPTPVTAAPATTPGFEPDRFTPTRAAQPAAQPTTQTDADAAKKAQEAADAEQEKLNQEKFKKGFKNRIMRAIIDEMGRANNGKK